MECSSSGCGRCTANPCDVEARVTVELVVVDPPLRGSADIEQDGEANRPRVEAASG